MEVEAETEEKNDDDDDDDDDDGVVSGATKLSANGAWGDGDNKKSSFDDVTIEGGCPVLGVLC